FFDDLLGFQLLGIARYKASKCHDTIVRSNCNICRIDARFPIEFIEHRSPQVDVDCHDHLLMLIDLAEFEIMTLKVPFWFSGRRQDATAGGDTCRTCAAGREPDLTVTSPHESRGFETSSQPVLWLAS